MFCTQCGQELPDNANFCLKCGVAQKEGVKRADQEEVRWELCEIVYEELSKKSKGFFSGDIYEYRFWARAKGPNGTYAAIIGDSFEIDDSLEALHISDKNKITIANAAEAVEIQLLQGGWELYKSAPSGHWRFNKYRRRVRA